MNYWNLVKLLLKKLTEYCYFLDEYFFNNKGIDHSGDVSMWLVL